MLHATAENYPIVFSNQRHVQPHSPEYINFQKKWGIIGTLYQMADEKVEKVGEINQLYLTDFMQFLTYMIEKQEVDRIEEKWNENRRRLERAR